MYSEDVEWCDLLVADPNAVADQCPPVAANGTDIPPATTTTVTSASSSTTFARCCRETTAFAVFTLALMSLSAIVAL